MRPSNRRLYCEYRPPISRPSPQEPYYPVLHSVPNRNDTARTIRHRSSSYHRYLSSTEVFTAETTRSQSSFEVAPMNKGWQVFYL
ncbi:hypothetical protein Y032_0243g3496 [Ancylostoma ceylanicum]|uniref:Uncharacterized protein n=1 Tax=Ancylostoma ceylanicum TaxID=53326 RepID=A0A016SDG5_9BILA|nr:hypothetical protein Y032_0243g3496 [Ancylostoma ceylanicum]